MTGGTEALYRQVLALFRKDVEDRLPMLQAMPELSALPALVTQIHALKSALGSLGAAKISEEAARLEDAGKAGDLPFIQENLSGFAERLKELTVGIDAALKTDVAAGMSNNGEKTDDLSDLSSSLRELESAIKSGNDSKIDRILDTLNEKPLDSKTKEILEKISEYVLMSEFDRAGKTLDDLLKGKNK